MTSQSDGKFSGKDGRRDKRRSFLPAPLKVQRSNNPEEQYSKTEYLDLVVGDRVLISGVKSGILLYYGKTHIAPGIWCGIALDDPDGKHDGKVEGVRYFNCFPGHGIFAPVERVEKIVTENIYGQKGIDEHFSPERSTQTSHHSKPARRLLPQPKVFTRTDSKEKITVPSKIDEQNEEAEEYLMVEKIERRQLPEKPTVGLSKFGFKPLSHRQYDVIDDQRVQQECTQSDVDSNLDHKNVLSETFVIKQGFNLNELESQIKSDINVSRNTQELSAPGSSDNSNLGDPKLLQINDLNKTFDIKNDSQTEVKPSSMTDSASSNEDSLSTDFKERLLADRPEYFNITFDTENGGSPPQNLPNVNVSPAKTASDIKQTPPSGSKSYGNDSSLGILNLDKVNTELLQNVFENSANLTDSEKLLNTVVIKPRNTGRIASVGDSFDISGAVTSSPLIDGVSRKPEQHLDSDVQNSRNVTLPVQNENLSLNEKLDSNKLCGFSETEEIKRNLNSTFKVDQSKPIAIIGDDTLDWRQEASDGEEPDEISDNSTDANIEVCKEEEKLSDVVVTRNQTVELLQKPKKAMVDSGISEMGDINNLEHGRMTDSVDSLRRSQNLEEMIASADSNFYEGDHKQLEADLKAGLLNKKDRPLSLISADTGYVPDTDSEFGTVTNSPLDWAEKQGMSQNISRSELDEAYSNTFKHFQAAVMKGTTRATSHALDYDSDICSDGGTILADTDTEKEESTDLENLSSAAIHDVKGLSAEEIFPENTAKMLESQVKTPTNPEMFVFPNKAEGKDEHHTDKLVESEAVSDSKTETEHKEADKDTTSVKTVSDNECEEEKKTEKSENKHKSKRKKEVEKIEYKKPNLNVGSRLSDYINAPLPVKPKEDVNTEEVKNKKNIFSKKKILPKSIGEESDSSKVQVEKEERIKKKVEKEPPKIIKRTPPKSKWGDIMSQIETNKEQSPTPKIEVKSKLQAYLSAPPPVVPKKETETKKESKVKKKLPATPTPDYSKIKSRLNLGAPAMIKREHSPGPNKRDQSPRGRLVADVARRLSSVSSVNSKIDLNESIGSSVIGSAISSTRGSHSDLNVPDSETGSKTHHKPSNRTVDHVSTMIRRNRRDSNSSMASDISQGSVKAMNARNTKLSEGQRRHSMPVKSSIPPPTNYQNKNKTNKTKNHVKSNHQQEAAPKSISPQAKQEITRLEALCESRTKELNYAKLQMKSTVQAFDAMSVLVNYLSFDLDAFSCPTLASKLQKLQQEFTESQGQIGELQSQKSTLEQEVVNLNQQHEQKITEINQGYNETIEQQKMTLSKDREEAVSKEKQLHEEALSKFKSSYEKEISDIRSSYDKTMHKVAELHQEEIKCLQCKHEDQMEELHKQHRDKLEDITHRFESIKMGLSEKVDTLRNECEDLKVRATSSEEALRKDSDTKVQMALAPFLNMPKEIESLKLVIELRNEEIQKLRKRNGDLEKRLEEIPIAREKIISLNQKMENLEAIVSMKTDHEKQLHEKCQMLMKKYDKESKANKRLSMNYEELLWKNNQGSESGSQENLWMLGSSPTDSDITGSPSAKRKTKSPVTTATGEVDRSPGRTAVYRRSVSANTGESSLDRKLKRRSANYLFDEKRTSPTGSPLHKRPHGSDSSSPSRLHIDTDHQQNKAERMCHSLNDADVFDVPQGLPNPPTPQELKTATSILENIDMSESQDNNHDVFNGPSSSQMECLKGKSSEYSSSVASDNRLTDHDEKGDIHLEIRDDLSDMSASVDSCSVSDITSSSLCWDYEKSEWTKSMDSSQTSDSILEQSTLTDSLQQDLNQSVVNHYDTHQCTSQNSSPQRHRKMTDSVSSPIKSSTPEKVVDDDCLCVVMSPETRSKEEEENVHSSPEILYIQDDNVSSFVTESQHTNINVRHSGELGKVASSSLQQVEDNTGKGFDFEGQGHCSNNDDSVLMDDCMRGGESTNMGDNQSESFGGVNEHVNERSRKVVKESTV